MDSITEFLSALQRRWPIVFWCATISFSVAFMAAFGTEAIYRSSGAIMVEQPTISPELATSTVAGLIEQRLQLVSRRVMSRDNLEPLVEDYGLYPGMPQDEKLTALRSATTLQQVDPITFEPSDGSSAFTVSFDYPDPIIARDVVREVIELFVDDNRKVRQESAAETERFFDAEANRLAASIAEAEGRLAEFKQRNQGTLPEDIERNQQILERIAEDRLDAQAQIRLANERRNLLAVQLEELSGGTELSKLRAELAIARQKYSADHPDIKRLTRAIEALEGSGEGANTMDVEYMRVAAQLEAVDAELAAVRRRDAELAARQTALEGKLVLAPEVERELQMLTREYELAKNEYEDIRQRRSAARIGSNLEDQDKGERYTVIRQASDPLLPISPNRVGIFLIAMLFAIGGGAGLVSLRESADVTVRGSRDIVTALQSPPIAVVPVIRNDADARHAWRRLAAHSVAFIVLLSITVGIASNG